NYRYIGIIGDSMFHRLFPNEPHRRFARTERGHEPAGHGRRHRSGRRSHRHEGELTRLLGHGDLRLLMLRLIQDKPRHGYEIIKEIENLAGGVYTPSPGVVYPTLTLLEEIGHVEGALIDQGKRQFTITDTGRAFLAANQIATDALFARLQQSTEA